MKILLISVQLLLFCISIGHAEPIIATAATLTIEGIALASSIMTIIQPFLQTENVAGVMKENLVELGRKIESMRPHIDNMQKKIVSEVYTSKLKTYQVDINAAINEFERIAKTATRDNIVNTLNNFISKHDLETDFKILKFLEQKVTLSESTLYHYANLANSLSDDYSNGLKYSPSSLLYEFQTTIFYHVMKYVSVLEQVTCARDYFQGSVFNKLKWTVRRNSLIEMYENIIRDSSNYVNSPKSLTSFIKLSTNLNGNETSFKKVFQTYWKNEDDLTQDCSSNCVLETRNFNDEHCHGKIGQCFYNKYFGSKTRTGVQLTAASTTGTENFEKYNIASDEMRIYSSYTLRGTPHGNYGPSKESFELKGYASGFRVCDVCQCTCDQINSPKTVRRIYAGIMQAPNGFVITGVRFAMQQNVFFLDIQYGKLLKNGIVDSTTLAWHGAPYELTLATFPIEFDLRNFVLDDVYFNDGQFLTGVQLIQRGNLIRTQIFGSRAAKSFNAGDNLSPFSNIGYSLTDKNLEEIKVQGKMIGLNLSDGNFIVTRSDERKASVQFGTSNERADAGQTCVPYFDTTEIIQDYPLALSGIGYVHYANDGYAGYLRPVLKSVEIKYFL